MSLLFYASLAIIAAMLVERSRTANRLGEKSSTKLLPAAPANSEDVSRAIMLAKICQISKKYLQISEGSS